MAEILHFKVSSGLKNIIGRELINDKFIAIFELVKNSYDAGAQNVRVEFIDIYGKSPVIIISDNGKGMTKDEVINKWLFVAYSEKRNTSYRDNLRKRRNYAGAKGVGRFSCDRLGERIVLTSKSKSDDYANVVKVNWNDFEEDDFKKFDSIDIEYDNVKDKRIGNSGTVIEIFGLREEWNRKEILNLKKALTQLVNPDSTDNYDKFEIFLKVKEELEEDSKIYLNAKNKSVEVYDKDIVNGVINNEIFSILQKRTTSISANISDDGKTITTILKDGHVELFKLVEKNKYQLKNINSTLYNMTSQAKNNFTRNMGIEPKNYGSVFIYKNGFRVFPYGEPGEDFFNIDQRKAQGYKRFFGTRDILGRIDIFGENSNFIETSSRNDGFIRGYEVTALEDFFYEYILKPLEKYCININNWAETLESDNELERSLKEFDTSEAFLKKIKPRYKSENMVSLHFDDRIVSFLDKKRSAPISKELEKLKESVINIEDETLLHQTKEVEKKTKELEKQVRESHKIANEAEQKSEVLERELEVTKKQVNVLSSVIDLDGDKAAKTMHNMKAYADTIDSVIDDVFDLLELRDDTEDIKGLMCKIRLACTKMMNSYNLVLNTEYTPDTGLVELDIHEFINDYTTKQWGHELKIDVISNAKNTLYNFNPLEFSIVIDNIIDNATKGNSRNMNIIIKDGKNGDLFISFHNDGYSLDDDVRDKDIFARGVTTTNGTGIGLNTVKEYLVKIGGEAFVNKECASGFELIVRLKNGLNL